MPLRSVDDLSESEKVAINYIRDSFGIRVSDKLLRIKKSGGGSFSVLSLYSINGSCSIYFYDNDDKEIVSMIGFENGSTKNILYSSLEEAIFSSAAIIS